VPPCLCGVQLMRPACPGACPELSLAAMPKRLYIETYGCQMNVADSELMFGILGRAGYQRTDEPADADVVLINTCAVRDNAEQRVIGRVGELQRYRRPDGVLGVVGCMAQRLGPRLLEQPGRVDLVVGPDAYRTLPELLALAAGGRRVSDTEFRSWEHYEDVPPVREPGPSAFVTVQRGCDYKCTFCIVPYTRGVERSRKLEDVVREVRTLAEQGVSEVTLLGQTVNSYHDGAHDFGDLLRAVGAVDGIARLRFTSPYPTDFTDRVVEAMATTPAVCEHVHLPVQSGSNSVLRRMLRRYTRECYLAIMARLRAAVPGITFTTDIIVGFPGETESDFEATLRLVAEADFDDAYTFRYSLREGTPAVRLKDHVPDEVAAARLQRLIEAVRTNARRKNLTRVGQTHEALVERPSRRGGLMLGRTRGNLLVLLDLPESAVGEYHRVQLTGTTGSTFTGRVAARELAVL
jgi:tRNA-2-methylthio-N6-dimethylallyladenosine synthase